MERWKDKVAIVTGASSGIGLTIAKGLLQNGLRVIAIARRINLLKQLEREFQSNNTECTKIKCLKCDVTKGNEVKEVIRWAEDNWSPVSVLVNCAGVFIHNPITGGTEETVRNIFSTNVFGMTNCIREVINSMLNYNLDEGHIININSICGHQVIVSPTLGIHTASKFAVTAITESLKNELTLKRLPIRTTSISPGLVETEMLKEVQDSDRMPKIQPEDVLNCILFALSTPKHVAITEITVQPVGEVLNGF